ncbi:MAG: hypothetical protein HKP30_18465 [Myxococcales bacterium]|nr:hypothetical protein [Myxococcales bacterium]
MSSDRFPLAWAVALLGALVPVALAVPAAALEDPTQPPRTSSHAGAEAPVSALALTAILGHGADRVAVIDGRRLRVGDGVGDATVARIERTLVELSGPDGPTTLTLFGPSVKAPAGSRKEQR